MSAASITPSRYCARVDGMNYTVSTTDMAREPVHARMHTHIYLDADDGSSCDDGPLGVLRWPDCCAETMHVRAPLDPHTIPYSINSYLVGGPRAPWCDLGQLGRRERVWEAWFENLTRGWVDVLRASSSL